jgi:hypothetical protein
MLLPAVGLTFDVVGAVLLTLGLFTHSRGLYPGLVTAPDDVARDAAFGFTGALLLVGGFVLQSFQYFGFAHQHSRCTTITAAVLGLVGSILLAWVVYGLAYIWKFGREVRWVNAQDWEIILPVARRKRNRLRFWNQEWQTQKPEVTTPPSPGAS